MYKAMRWLAIVALLVTIAGAGLVLYALNTMTPEVLDVTIVRTPAAQAQDVFDGAMAQIAEGSFTGRVFADAEGLTAEECAFETYTVRVENKGLFPAEWIALDISPVSTESGADVLEMGDTGAYALASGAEGDIMATVLTTMPEGEAVRQIRVSGYVFGQKFDICAVP